jgi:phosphopantothenoylcysteine synthetase/decarboxylase
MRKLAPDAVICGFKLLVDSTEDELLEAMRKQVDESGVDLVVGNDLRDIKNDDHQLLVVSRHDSNPRKYKKDDGNARRSFVYPLAEAVVSECLSELEHKKSANK